MFKNLVAGEWQDGAAVSRNAPWNFPIAIPAWKIAPALARQ